MKLLLILILLPLSTFASISGSPLSPRHQQVIAEAVYKKCGHGRHLTYVSHTQRDFKVDQGIIDTYFTTELAFMVRVDQGIFDTYKVVVESLYSSHYDHIARQWGAYNVESVTCILQ